MPVVQTPPLASHTGVLSEHGSLVLFPTVVLLPFLYCIYVFIRNVYFHPLSKYPGPRLAAATSLWYAWIHHHGQTPMELLKLHNRYGSVVRVAPEELSFIDPVAWKEIYGHKSQGQAELLKDKKYHAFTGGEQTLVNADKEYHGVLRKLLAHGFSDKALREQESIIQSYVDTLMKRLHEHGQDGKVALDMVKWYNFFTFDIIGYLTYGEPFDCLSSSKMSKWIDLFFGVTRWAAYQQVVGRFAGPLQGIYKKYLIPQRAKHDFKTDHELSLAKVRQRLRTPATVPDFMEKLVGAYNSQKMSLSQLNINAKILLGAGSETTATFLAGATYYLVKHPEVLNRLNKEIRDKFQSPNEITMTTVNQCPYLWACLEEALRIYPPSPATHARHIPPGGMIIAGEFVPEYTAVGVPIYAICNSPLNFKDPRKFIPQRWMREASEYDSDKKEAAQAFSVGPRNCIGRNLAYLEMKLVIAKLVWFFDLEDGGIGNWLTDQMVYMVWEKGPLMIKLNPVQRG